MLYLYQSNRVEMLSELFTSMVNTAPLTNVFQAEVVMIQSRSMQKWLALELAKKMGIAANFDFVLPAGYVWRLMQTVLPPLAAISQFAPQVLIWRVMNVLSSCDGAAFEPLNVYQRRGELAQLELAGKISDIFDQYQVFRPDWLRCWEQGKTLGLGEHEQWQAALWKKLVDEEPAPHRVRLMDKLISGLSAQHLPERITLFGITNLPPMYLTFIRRLAELTDVCLFVLNPCAEYWGSIRQTHGQLAICFVDEAGEEGHPLLASLGRQGKDFIDQIIEYFPTSRDWFVPPDGNSILVRLQRDILTLTPPEANARWPDDSDDSIEIHITHSPVRELEAVKNFILANLAQDPTLSLADIVVLVPDIQSYAPYVEAVFGTYTSTQHIPYCMTDQSLTAVEPLLVTFITILDLMESRFAVNDVMALLDCPAILAKFSLTSDSVPQLYQWVRESGIRWGLDSEHKSRLGLPPDPLYTWRWGLDRLLLGSILPEALAGENSPVFSSLLPASSIVGEAVDQLAAFCQFFYILQGLANQWREPDTINGWYRRLNEALQVLFMPLPGDENALSMLRGALDDLLTETTLAKFHGTVGLPVIRHWFKARLSSFSTERFLAGGVTFSALVPMRSLPCRVLCLLGMNAGVYPRDERSMSFDLIAQYPRRGDRSRRLDDRSLFLEAILSARAKLYFSYVGFSERNGEPLSPSVLIVELIDALARMSGARTKTEREALERHFTVRHPVHPFSAQYFDQGHPKLFSYDDHYAYGLSQPSITTKPFVTPEALVLPDLSKHIKVIFHNFVYFWCLPCRAWLKEKFDIRIKPSDEQWLAREPFILQRRLADNLRHMLSQALLNGQPLQPLEERLQATGFLPPGLLGRAWLADELVKSRRFIASLPSLLKQQASHVTAEALSFHFSMGRFTLEGELTCLTHEGYIEFIARPAYATEIISRWLAHLVLCVAAPENIKVKTRLYTEQDVYLWESVPDARQLLSVWLDYWLQGQSLPLPFFPRTSLAYARQLYKSEDIRRARAHAFMKWDPTFETSAQLGQKHEPSIALVFRNSYPLDDPLFHELAVSLLVPLYKYCKPLDYEPA